MTLPELLLALDEDLEKKRPPAGGVDVRGPAAKQALAQRWRNLTREEKLQQARER